MDKYEPLEIGRPLISGDHKKANASSYLYTSMQKMA